MLTDKERDKYWREYIKLRDTYHATKQQLEHSLVMLKAKFDEDFKQLGKKYNLSSKQYEMEQAQDR